LDSLIVRRIDTELDSPYIVKPLHKNTVSKMLKGNDTTIYRLYQITDNKKELNYFAEIVGDNTYSFSAYIKTTFAFAGGAREQIKNIGQFGKLLRNTPKYEVRCSLKELYTNKTVFNYNHEVSTEALAYNSMEHCLRELNNKLTEKVS
jgi:hypothetical protein